MHVPEGFSVHMTPLDNPGVAPYRPAASSSHSNPHAQGPRPPMFSMRGEAPEEQRRGVAPVPSHLDQHIPPANMHSKRTSRRYNRTAAFKVQERLWSEGVAPCPHRRRSRSPRDVGLRCTGDYCNGANQGARFCGRQPPLCAKCCRNAEMNEGVPGYCQAGMSWHDAELHWDGHSNRGQRY